MIPLLPPEAPWCVDKLTYALKQGFAIAASLHVNAMEVVILLQRGEQKYLIIASEAVLERAQWRFEKEGSK